VLHEIRNFSAWNQVLKNKSPSEWAVCTAFYANYCRACTVFQNVKRLVNLSSEETVSYLLVYFTVHVSAGLFCGAHSNLGPYRSVE